MTHDKVPDVGKEGCLCECCLADCPRHRDGGDDRVLDVIIQRSNDESEMAELPCHDGWHGGDHPTDVIRISYLEKIVDSMRGEQR